MAVYQSLTVSNFRCFESLSLGNLGRVNLIAGSNNSGKTALLEAMYLHAMRGDPYAVIDIVRQRGYQRRSADWPDGGLPWEPLFRDFETSGDIRVDAVVMPRPVVDPWGQASLLPLGALGHAGGAVARTALVVRDRADMSRPGLDLDESQLTAKSRRELEERGISAVLEVSLETPGDEARATYLTDHDFRAARPVRSRADRMDVTFLTARSNSTLLDSARFSAVAQAKRTRDLVDVLSVIEPRLRDLQYLPQGAHYGLYGDIGLPRLVYLGDMGEGMNRLASIALALWTASGGLVLVDEVENGLHHTVHEDVWRAIGEAARRFDVQVVATTHSLECIRAAHRASRAAETYDLRTYRLQQVRGAAHAFAYEDEELEAAIEAGMEVR